MALIRTVALYLYYLYLYCIYMFLLYSTVRVLYSYGTGAAFFIIQAKRGMGALPASRVSILMLRNVRGA